MLRKAFLLVAITALVGIVAVVYGLAELAGEEGMRSNPEIQSLSATPAMPHLAQQQRNHSDDSAQLEYERDRAAIEALRQANDLDGLVRVADELEKKWSLRGGDIYARLMLDASNIIGNGFNDSRIYSLSQKYALLALTKADGFSLEIETQLLPFIEMDIARSDTSDEAEAVWQKERSAKAKLWLHAWGRIEREIDRSFNFDNRPRLKIRPPDETGLPAGIAPEAIKDQRLRAEYEAAIAANTKATLRYNHQYRLRSIKESFTPKAEKYLIRIYSKRPYNVNELKRYLTTYLANKSLRDRILSSVSEGIGSP